MNPALSSRPSNQGGTVLVLQHVEVEGPGLIADAITHRGAAAHVIRIFDGEPVPTSLADAVDRVGAPIAGLVIMGGPMGVYEGDRFPHLRDELKLIESVLRAELPLLGICLGSQLLACALGARVSPGPAKEIGWFDVRLHPEAQSDPLWEGLPNKFTALHWHGDVFDLPAGATQLASSELTAQQAFRYGKDAYGFLFHLEAGLTQIEAMISTFADELADAQLSPAQIRSETTQYLTPVAAVGERVFSRWAGRLR